jgi:hypothetical protein
MPSKNTSIVSFTDAIIRLDKTTVNDSIDICSQIDISRSGWKITGNSSKLSLEKKNRCMSSFSSTDGLVATSIKTPTAVLSNSISSGFTSIANNKQEVHHYYGQPVSTHTSTMLDNYIVSMSGHRYIKYTPTGLNNTNTLSLYQRSPVYNNPNSFGLLFDATFTGVSNMNNSIVRGDYNFDILFELLPFYHYAGQNANTGILRIYSQNNGTLKLIQTLNDATFNMTDFQVSADGNYILITSASKHSAFKVYKRDKESDVWTLYHSCLVCSDSTMAESVLPIAFSRNGNSFMLRGKCDGGLNYNVIVYSNTGNGFKYDTELTRFNMTASPTTGKFGSYSPDGLELVISDNDNMSVEIYEWFDSGWREKQQILLTATCCNASYNGAFIHTIGAANEWNVWARKHNGIYKLVSRQCTDSGSACTALTVDDQDIIHYITCNEYGACILTSVYPIGGALGGTTSTCDIQNVRPKGKDACIDIGSDTNVYIDIYTQNAVTVAADINLKKNILPITNCVELLNDMRPVSYKHRDGECIHYGFSATDKRSIIYSEITPLLAGALREISNRIDNIV